MSATDGLCLRVLGSLNNVAAADWDACANPQGVPYNPFVRHAFLLALEESGSAIADTGWFSQHIAVENAEGEIVAAMPLYLKNHSQGEYIFDQGWADAFYRAGGEYYPKLLCAVPFTPAAGRRLLVRACADTTVHEFRCAVQYSRLVGEIGCAVDIAANTHNLLQL